MDGENNNESRPEAGSRRDGNIDFSRYATQQLEELRDSLDPAASPLNHAALLAELARRTASAAQVPRWQGRFTRWSGLPGWLAAKLRRAPLYGKGTVDLTAEHLVLQGWQRTWLGFAIERALYLPLERVRNVIPTMKSVRLQVSRRGWFARNIEFLPDDPTQREAIVQALPQTRTARFGKYGASLVAFEEQLRARCPVAWLTPVLVLLNLVMFGAMWMQAGALSGAVDTPLALLAANIGPLTLDGQWWRLLSAIFVHVDLWHLLLNMWALWNIGRLSERLYGRGTFLAVYLGCGVFASLSSLLWDPARSTVGASGAIFALFGAFLAHLLRHRRAVPRGVFRSHWIPTLLFVGFSLFNGAVAAGVDNAAHAGGLLCGFTMGLLLYRSTAVPDAAPRLRWAPGLAVYLLCAGSALSYVLWTRGPVPVGQQFAARHGWYVSGEARSVAAWRQLAGAAGAGVISDEDLGARIGKEVLPFWKEAASRLAAEVPSLMGEEQRYVRAFAEFARLRMEWAEAVVGATTGRNREMLEVARSKDQEGETQVARIERLSARSNAARMTGGLVHLPLVQRMRSRLISRNGKCVEPPPAYQVSVPVAASDSSTDSPATLRRIGCQAQEIFLGGEFRKLDAMFADAAAHTGDLPVGASTLSALLGGLSDLIYYSKSGNIEQYLRHLAMWRRALPDSYYPDLLEAELYQLWAWTVRGHGTASQITQQAWALFSYRNEMAQASLDDSGDSARRDPLWCYLSMRLQHDRAHDIEPIEQTYRKCIAQFPRYASLHGSMLRSLMPRWYGSSQKVAEFIENMAAAQPAEQQDAMYAQLYWTYADLEGDDTNIFEESGADWERIDKGFDSLQEQYPQSDVVLNAHARFACIARDDVIFRWLRTQLRGRRSASAWTKKTTLEGCSTGMFYWNRPAPARQ